MTAAERYIEAQGTVGMISGLLLDPEEGAEKLQEVLSHALALRTAREQIAATMIAPSHAV